MTKYAVFVSTLLIAMVLPASAQMDNGAYLESFKADFEGSSGKLASLAGAFDEEQFAWRPAEDIRSMGEVLTHVIMGNNGMSRLLGLEGAVEMPGDDASQEELITALMASQQAVMMMADMLSDVELTGMVEFYGQEMSRYRVLAILAGHSHEHLGQGIAYARSVGVTPPWSQ